MGSNQQPPTNSITLKARIQAKELSDYLPTQKPQTSSSENHDLQHAIRELQQSITESESFLGQKDEELKAYSQDEIQFLKNVIPIVRQRSDKMIEFPLPFKQPN